MNRHASNSSAVSRLSSRPLRFLHIPLSRDMFLRKQGRGRASWPDSPGSSRPVQGALQPHVLLQPSGCLRLAIKPTCSTREHLETNNLMVYHKDVL